MKITQFEDIQAWKMARKLTREIYRLGQSRFPRDFSLRDQIQRAAVSIMANIAEGFDSQSRPEFIRFLSYARRSTSEVQSHLYAALDRDYLTELEFKDVYRDAVCVKNLIGGFIRYLDGKKRTGALEHGSTETRPPKESIDLGGEIL